MIWPFNRLIEKRYTRKSIRIYFALLSGHEGFSRFSNSHLSPEHSNILCKYDLVFSLASMYCMLSSVSPSIARLFLNCASIERFACDDGFTALKLECLVHRFDDALALGLISSVKSGLAFLIDELFERSEIHLPSDVVNNYIGYSIMFSRSVFSSDFSFNLDSPLVNPLTDSASFDEVSFYCKFYPCFFGFLFLVCLILFHLFMPSSDKVRILFNAWGHTSLWIVLIATSALSCLVSAYYVLGGLILSLNSKSKSEGLSARSVLISSILSLALSFVSCCPLSYLAFYYEDSSSSSFDNKPLSKDPPLSDFDRLNSLSIKKLSE